MANTTYDTIKSMKPAPWSKSTVADGNALNQNFLEPTHQKDLTLAAAIDQVKNTVDEYNEVINEINDIADAAQHQAQEAENSVVDLDTNLNIVSAGLADAASAISALETNKQDKIYVDPTTISGDGSHDNPYTVIGGGGGGGPVPTIVGNMGVSAAYVSENNQYVIGLSGTKNLVFESSADTIVFASSAAGKYNFEVNPELVNKWNAGTSAFTNNGFSGIGTSSSRIGVDETGMSTSYKYGWNPQLHKWSEINEGGGTGTTYNFDNGPNGTLSGNGHDNPIAVNTDVLATKNWVSEQQYIANVSIDSTYLSGDGATHPIGINNSYTEHWNDAYNVSEAYKLASGRYDAHSALSATKLDKSIWDNNSGKFVTSAGLDPDIQYAMTTNGWAEITGGSSFTGAETDNWISGDGTSNKPIGLSAEAASAIEAMADQYQIDGGQYVSVLPNSTTHKVVVGLDNQAANAIADVIASANIWDEASAVSTKSHTTINANQVITTENQGTSASVSAVQYVNHETFGTAPKQLFVCQNDYDLINHLNICNGKGTLFFVCSAI